MTIMRTLSDRFWEKVIVGGPDECWLWVGSKSKGYGHIGAGGFRGKTLRAHRVSYELSIGPIADSLDVLHICDTPSCVNPKHLFQGTHNENMADKVSKGRQHRPSLNLVCLRGHPFTDETTKWYRGARTCRVCLRHRKATYRQQKSGAA